MTGVPLRPYRRGPAPVAGPPARLAEGGGPLALRSAGSGLTAGPPALLAALRALLVGCLVVPQVLVLAVQARCSGRCHQGQSSCR